ncbi:hypothetical protein [Rhizobium anhuiense]
MPYAKGGRLPAETASKLGHLTVVQSDWVRSLISEFEDPTMVGSGKVPDPWNAATSTSKPLSRVWAVDGSFVSVKAEAGAGREVAFVKTALLTVDRVRLGAIDKDNPHPLLLQDIMADSAIFHATVFPLKNVRTSLGSNYDAVRHIVRDSMKIDENGAFYQTLKWLAYSSWSSAPTRSPSFNCPHCNEIVDGLATGVDEAPCRNCGGEVFLSDMLGFHLDMDEESAPESVASSYMLVMEHLMIFTAIRAFWEHTDKNLVSETLFIKDGPLTLRSQYSKLIPAIRSFLQHAKTAGRPIHVIGQEKSGAFRDHLESIAKTVEPTERGHPPSYAVLTHDYIRQEVYRSPDLKNPYGSRTNWGEKVYLKLDPGTALVINVPTGDYDPDGAFPTAGDLIGLERILATLPDLVSHKFEGALFPIELANGVASMSSYPSSKVLQRFLES